MEPITMDEILKVAVLLAEESAKETPPIEGKPMRIILMLIQGFEQKMFDAETCVRAIDEVHKATMQIAAEDALFQMISQLGQPPPPSGEIH